MYKRHFLALLITIGIYYIPSMIYNGAWIYSAVCSLAYIILIYKYAKIRLMPMLLAAETIAVISMLISFIENNILGRDGFFYTNYELIINACFAAELIIIAVGVMGGGPIKRIQRIWHSIRDSDSHHRSIVLRGEKFV